MSRRRLSSRQARKALLVRETKLLQTSLALELCDATRDARLLRRRAVLALAGLRLGCKIWRCLKRRRARQA